MAIFHFHVEGCCPTRTSGAVQKAAWQSGETLYSARKKELCRYGKRAEIVECGLCLPDGIKLTREDLWNRAEFAWQGGCYLVASQYDIALPIELPYELRKACVSDFCALFKAQGRACDWSILEKEDGGNPRMSVLVSALPLDKNGFFTRPKGPKTTRKYLCRSPEGEDRKLSQEEWKQVKPLGWGKVYNWPDRENEGKRLRLTIAEAKALGMTTKHDRIGKCPVTYAFDAVTGESTAGRNIRELKELRAQWADIANKRLAEYAELAGTEPMTIDSRSNEERGLSVEATVHEGWAGTYVHDGAVELNGEIKKKNDEIRHLEKEIEDTAADLTALQEEISRLEGIKNAEKRQQISHI